MLTPKDGFTLLNALRKTDKKPNTRRDNRPYTVPPPLKNATVQPQRTAATTPAIGDDLVADALAGRNIRPRTVPPLAPAGTQRMPVQPIPVGEQRGSTARPIQPIPNNADQIGNELAGATTNTQQPIVNRNVLQRGVGAVGQALRSFGEFAGSARGQEFFGRVAVLLAEPGTGAAQVGENLIAGATAEREAEVFARILAGEDPSEIDMSAISAEGQTKALGQINTMEDQRLREEELNLRRLQLQQQSDEAIREMGQIDATRRKAIEDDVAVRFFYSARESMPPEFKQLNDFMLAMQDPVTGGVSPVKIRAIIQNNPELAEKYEQTRLTMLKLVQAGLDPIEASAAYDTIVKRGLNAAVNETTATQSASEGIAQSASQTQEQTQQGVQQSGTQPQPQPTPSQTGQTARRVNFNGLSQVEVGVPFVYTGGNPALSQFENTTVMIRVDSNGRRRLVPVQ